MRRYCAQHCCRGDDRNARRIDNSGHARHPAQLARSPASHRDTSLRRMRRDAKCFARRLLRLRQRDYVRSDRPCPASRQAVCGDGAPLRISRPSAASPIVPSPRRDRRLLSAAADGPSARAPAPESRDRASVSGPGVEHRIAPPSSGLPNGRVEQDRRRNASSTHRPTARSATSAEAGRCVPWRQDRRGSPGAPLRATVSGGLVAKNAALDDAWCVTTDRSRGSSGSQASSSKIERARDRSPADEIRAISESSPDAGCLRRSDSSP